MDREGRENETMTEIWQVRSGNGAEISTPTPSIPAPQQTMPKYHGFTYTFYVKCLKFQKEPVYLAWSQALAISHRPPQPVPSPRRHQPFSTSAPADHPILPQTRISCPAITPSIIHAGSL
jgi:hypothetical protein